MILPLVSQLAAEIGLHLAEDSLALLRENPADRLAGPLLDDLVHVDEEAAQPFGHGPAHGRLARAHEAGQNDVVLIHDLSSR